MLSGMYRTSNYFLKVTRPILARRYGAMHAHDEDFTNPIMIFTFQLLYNIFLYLPVRTITFELN